MSGENSPPEREVLRPTGEVTPVSKVPDIVKDTVTGLGVPQTTTGDVYESGEDTQGSTWERGAHTFTDNIGREYHSVSGGTASADQIEGHPKYREGREAPAETPQPAPATETPPPAKAEVSTPKPTATYEPRHYAQEADNVPFGSGNGDNIPFNPRYSSGLAHPVEISQPEAPTTVPAEPAVTSPQPTEGSASWQQRWADVEKTLDSDLRDRFVAASNRLLTHTQYSDRLTNDPHELERVTALRAKEVLNTPKYTNYGQGSPSDASRHFETDQARKQLAAEAVNSSELANALFQNDVLDIGSKNPNEAVQLVERLNNQWPELTQRLADAKAAGQDLTAANVLRQAVGLEPGQTAPPPDTNPSPPTVAEHKGLIGRFIDRFRHHEQPNPAEATAGPEETQDVPPGYKNLAQKTLDLIGTGKDKVMRSDRAMFVLGGLAGVPVGMVASRLGLASETVQSNLYWITAGAELAKLGILAHINRGRVAETEAGDTDGEKVAKGSLFKGFAVGGLVGALSGAEQAIISGAVHEAPNFQEHTLPTLEHQAAAEVPQVEHAAQHWVEQQVHDFQNPPPQTSHPNPIPTPPTGEVATPPPHAVEAPQPAPVHHPEIHIGNQGDSFDSAFQRFLDTDDGKNLLGFDHPGWVNPDNGITQQEVLAAMVEDYAQQNGHDVAHVDPNSAFSLTSGDPNAQSLDLTPEQLENLRRVAQTNLVGQFLSMQPMLGLTGQR